MLNNEKFSEQTLVHASCSHANFLISSASPSTPSTHSSNKANSHPPSGNRTVCSLLVKPKCLSWLLTIVNLLKKLLAHLVVKPPTIGMGLGFKAKLSQTCQKCRRYERGSRWMSIEINGWSLLTLSKFFCLSLGRRRFWRVLIQESSMSCQHVGGTPVRQRAQMERRTCRGWHGREKEGQAGNAKGEIDYRD
jgi:hypothetical protein